MTSRYIVVDDSTGLEIPEGQMTWEIRSMYFSSEHYVSLQAVTARIPVIFLEDERRTEVIIKRVSA